MSVRRPSVGAPTGVNDGNSRLGVLPEAVRPLTRSARCWAAAAAAAARAAAPTAAVARCAATDCPGGGDGGGGG